MKIALVQMRSGVDVMDNLADSEAAIREAAAKGARLIATPECTHLIQKDKDALFSAIKAPDTDPGMVRYADLAEALNIDLFIGSMAQLGPDGRAVNRSYHFGPEGRIKAQYDKIHMFDVSLGQGETYSESTNYARGRRAVISEAQGAKIGLSICYDVRFAYLYRRLAQAGAQILMVPAAFTQPTGRAHWEVLLRARAIETGSYVLAAAQGGKHEDGRKTYGHSLVINPWGEVIAELDHNEPGLLYAELDLEAVTIARGRIPALQGDQEIEGP